MRTASAQAATPVTFAGETRLQRIRSPHGAAISTNWPSQRRATRAISGGRAYWVCAERAASFRPIYSDADSNRSYPRSARPPSPAKKRSLLLAAGWMSHSGPTTVDGVERLLGLPEAEMDKALLAPRSERRDFARPVHRRHARSTTEWCDRRLLARIHRLTLGGLRKQIQPVSPAQFMRWLLRWQHVAPGSQLAGERGLLEIFASCRVSRPRPTPGSSRFCAAASPATRPKCSTSFASPAQ